MPVGICIRVRYKVGDVRGLPMNAFDKPVVLAVGDAAHVEFAEVVNLLREQTQVVFCETVEDAAVSLWKSDFVPQWIVFLQTLPGEFRKEACQTFWTHYPLVRIVRVLGSWCEGEIRTGTPWPGTTRMYWHQAVVRITAELNALPRGLTTWGEPLTMSDDDRLLAKKRYSKRTLGGTLGIYAQTFDAAESLSDAIAMRGYSSVWMQPDRHVLSHEFQACLFDFAHGSEREFAELIALSSSHPDVPIIALLNFPRLDDRARALQAGAVAVLSKPMQLDDLFAELAHARHAQAAARQQHA